ncbi:3'-5' RNA helicase YTHDC2 [Nymphon striatum]|nr:3'-5' RNA helicase YTHDC2 [Nymphon striatum]
MTAEQHSALIKPSFSNDLKRLFDAKIHPNEGVTEDFRVSVKLALEQFSKDNEDTLAFPSSLLAEQRAFIHKFCLKLGLKTKSRGKNVNRHITVMKKPKKTTHVSDAAFEFTDFSEKAMLQLMQHCPLSNKEKQDLQPHVEHVSSFNYEVPDIPKPTGCLTNIIPQVPPKSGFQDPNATALPIHTIKNQFLEVLEQHQVIPQFILDKSYNSKQPCRILCTQPRRIAALSVSDRVAYERNEKLGDTVGYQIRLESKISLRTVLLFSTNGVLLRTLMGCEDRLSSVTHIIVDEIHEREKLSDFLLIVMRHLLPKYPKLKLILMSATLDTDLFIKYFNDCPVIKVPSRTYPVDEVYLEDILEKLEYRSPAMMKLKNEDSSVLAKKKRLSSWYASSENGISVLKNSVEDSVTETDPHLSTSVVDMDYDIEGVKMLDSKKSQLIDDVLSSAWLIGGVEEFKKLLGILADENIPVDYTHSETGASALMLAAGRGHLDIVEMLLLLGASVNLKAPNNWNAVEWAKVFNHEDVVDFLTAHQPTECSTTVTNYDDMEIASKENNELLELYQKSVNEDQYIDYNLLLTLLFYVHASCDPGGILVFLPGYADLVLMCDKITNDQLFQKKSKFVLYTLHSSMQTSDQKKVFKRPPKGVRKIILSTNIAETSVTIDDIVYVVDCGKVKQKSYNSSTKVTLLAPVWISKSSAIQRKGRSGRCQPGIVFRLYSSFRFKNMDNFQCPEILRTPLHELCLHAKCLASKQMSIYEFLGSAPEPPVVTDIKNSIELLLSIDALNTSEELTELGKHLIDLPLDPTLGKMVLYSVVLKCLDPILTIVCSLAYKDPFTIPSDNRRQTLLQIKKNFAGQSFSDHMVLLRAFQSWQKARSEGQERNFIQKNFLSSATFEMIAGMRSQLLGQLRASGFVHAKGSGNIRDLNTNSENWAVVKAALFVGLYPNVIRVDGTTNKLVTRLIKKVKLHCSSVLKAEVLSKPVAQTLDESYASIVNSLNSEWLIFDEMTKIGYMAFARSCTSITPITVALFAGPARLPPDCVTCQLPENTNEDSDSECEVEENEQNTYSTFEIDDWLSFQLSPNNIQLLMHLRQKWHALFLKRLRNPSKPWMQCDEMVLSTLVNVLTSQEQDLGLQQPVGIGQRPKPMMLDYSCNVPAGYNQKDNSFDRASSYSGQSSRLNDRGDSMLNTRSSPQQSEASTKYFMLRVTLKYNIEQFFDSYCWKFVTKADKMFQNAVLNGQLVFVIVHIEGSETFHSYGIMSFHGSRFSQGGFYKISWVERTELPFQTVSNVCSPWSLIDNHPSSNGNFGKVTLQEISPNIGDIIVKRWVENNAKPPFYRNQSYSSHNTPPLMQDNQPSSRHQPQHGRAIRGQRHYFHPRRSSPNLTGINGSTHDKVKRAGETFVLKLYGASNFESLDKYRHIAYKRAIGRCSPSSSFQLASLPPTSAAAKKHSYRTYHTVQEWMGNTLPPIEWGWRSHDGTLAPVETDRPVAPESLLNMVSCS